MENKKCVKCGIDKAASEFRDKRNQCKVCEREMNKLYTINNKDKEKNRKKVYYENTKPKQRELGKHYRTENRDKIKIIMKSWRDENKESIKEYTQRYNEKNKENIVINKKAYNVKNKDKINDYQREYGKEYREINKEKLKEYNQNYRLKNKEKINRKKQDYLRNRKINSPLFKLSTSFRSNLGKSFKRYGYTKKSKTHEILGCSFDEFKIYLENKFESWMNWDNKGLYDGTPNYGWDIDHIIPLSSAKTEEELIDLLHYNNCQPLCSYTNRDIKKNFH